MRNVSRGFAATLLFFAVSAGGSPLFPSHDDYQAGTTTIGAGIGDIDGDGDLDLIGANGNGNSVTVMRNRGAGLYDVLASYPAGAGAGPVVMRDWNSDGLMDLAVACGGSNVFTIYLGRTDATLASRLDVPVGTVSSAGDIAAADFDGDGHFDVAVTDLARSLVAVYEGHGDGTFTHRGDWPSPTAPHGIAAADLNADGISDIAAAGGSSVSALLGAGDGTLGSTSGPYAVGNNPVRVAAGDVNHDGRIDLVTANRGAAHVPDSTISILLGVGGGAFTREPDRVTQRGPEAVALADLDGNGDMDIAVVHVGIPGVVSMFPGRGDGTFGTRLDFGTGGSPRAISTGDLNADGLLDLVTANYFDNSLSVLLNSGTVTSVSEGSIHGGRLALAASPSPAAREIRFTIRGTPGGAAALALYDVRGRLVGRPFEGSLSRNGEAVVVWDGRDRSGRPSASGVYWARLHAVSESVTLRVVRLRR